MHTATESDRCMPSADALPSQDIGLSHVQQISTERSASAGRQVAPYSVVIPYSSANTFVPSPCPEICWFAIQALTGKVSNVVGMSCAFFPILMTALLGVSQYRVAGRAAGHAGSFMSTHVALHIFVDVAA